MLLICHSVLSTGSVIYSEVTAFLKIDHMMITKYQSITTLSNESLKLSADHLVYTRKYSGDKFNPM